MDRRPGRPTPPRPGSTSDAYLAAVRIEELRPSALLVLGVYGLAAARLYVTLVAEAIELIRDDDFAQPEDRDAFIAVARAHTAR